MYVSVQQILALRATDSLNHEKRLLMKKSGRPTPTLNIKHTTKEKGRDVNRYFRQSMYESCKWICGCAIKQAFFCFPCLLFSADHLWTKHGVTDLKHLQEKIKKHSVCGEHMNSEMNLASLGRVDIKIQLDSAYRKSVIDFNEKVSKNRYIVCKVIDCIKFCGAFELALRGHDEAESLSNVGIFSGLVDFVSELDIIFKEHTDKSGVMKGVSKTTQNDLLLAMLTVVQNKIKVEVEQSDFVAIQVDEATDSSSKNQMAIIIRYVLNGHVHERFWNFIQPQETTADALANVILNELEKLKINEKPEKLIAQSYGGTAWMSGNIKGAQKIIKQSYPQAHFVHSYAHQLNVILQKTVSKHKEVKIFFAHLQTFASFFGNSPKRTAVLDEVVTARLRQPAPSKWYFNSKCIEIVYTHKLELVQCLEKIMDTEFDNVTISQAGCLKGFLENDVFLYWLNYFHLIMTHVDVLFDQLQKHDIDNTYINTCISDFNTNIQNIRDNSVVKCEPSSPTYNDTNTAELTHARKRRKTEDSEKIIALVCDIIVSEIRCRFAYTDHLIVSCLLHTDKFVSYKKKFPQNILNVVRRNYPTINGHKLETELTVLYGRDDVPTGAGAIAMLQMFMDLNLCETFSETVKLIQILCTIPMTTVESDRCFTTLKRLKTFLRNTVEQSRLSALAMLSVEKEFIKGIQNFNEEVIDNFAMRNNTGLFDLIYKHV